MNMNTIRATVNSRILTLSTVNSNKEDITTVNCDPVASQIQEVFDHAHIKPEGIAKLLAEGLDDLKSERYYFILASNISPVKLFEALSITKDTANRNTIRTNKAIYFQAILKKWDLKTKFK